MAAFLIYALLSAAGMFFSTLLLAPLGEDWLIFGLILGGAVLGCLRVLWEKLDRIEQKLDALAERQKEN